MTSKTENNNNNNNNDELTFMHNEKQQVTNESTGIQATYIQIHEKNLSCTMFLCADMASNIPFPLDHPFRLPFGSNDEEIKDWTWVCRANTLEIINRDIISYTPDFANPRLLLSKEPIITKIGNTSFDIQHNLYRRIIKSNGQPPEDILIGRLWSKNVMVSRAELRPIPIVRKELLKNSVFPDKLINYDHIPKVIGTQKDVGIDLTPPSNAFIWNTVSRITDCDNLGHINNTKYTTIAEEALSIAAYKNAFNYHPIASANANLPITTIHVEYIDQIKPFEDLEIAVWYHDSVKAFIIRMKIKSSGVIASYVTIGHEGSKPMSWSL